MILDARTQLVLAGNFMIYLFLLASKAEEVQATYKLLENFRESLHNIGSFETEESRAVFRPVTLRIDSFFNHAAQIMRGHSTIDTTALGRMVDISP